MLTQAMYQARELAMTRMEEEADKLGADGIVGVRLESTGTSGERDLAEFMAIGTAVAPRARAHRAPNSRPFTSDLSGQDFWTLLTAGYRPVGLVMGTASTTSRIKGYAAGFKQVGRNVEMPNYTQALYDARELAMERMQAEAEGAGRGIVGAQIQESSHGWGSTSSSSSPSAPQSSRLGADHEIPQPSLVLTLNDPPTTGA